MHLNHVVDNVQKRGNNRQNSDEGMSCTGAAQRFRDLLRRRTANGSARVSRHGLADLADKATDGVSHSAVSAHKRKSRTVAAMTGAVPRGTPLSRRPAGVCHPYKHDVVHSTDATGIPYSVTGAR